MFEGSSLWAPHNTWSWCFRRLWATQHGGWEPLGEQSTLKHLFNYLPWLLRESVSHHPPAPNTCMSLVQIGHSPQPKHWELSLPSSLQTCFKCGLLTWWCVCKQQDPCWNFMLPFHWYPSFTVGSECSLGLLLICVTWGLLKMALGFQCCAFVRRSGLSLLERSHPEVTCVLFSVVAGDDIPSHRSITSCLPGLPIGKLFPLLNLQALVWEVLCNHHLAPFKLSIRFWFQNKLTGAHLIQWVVIFSY